MPDSYLSQYLPKTSFLYAFHQYLNICRVFARRNDLEQLVQWAKRKRLKQLTVHYRKLSIDEEQRLWLYRVRTPRFYALAQVSVFLLNAIFFPAETRYRKGYAAKYRLRNRSLV